MLPVTPPPEPPSRRMRRHGIVVSIMLIAVAGMLNGWSYSEERDGCGEIHTKTTLNGLTGQVNETLVRIVITPAERRSLVQSLRISQMPLQGASAPETLAVLPPAAGGGVTARAISVQAPATVTVTALDGCGNELVSASLSNGFTLHEDGLGGWEMSGPDALDFTLVIPDATRPCPSPSSSPVASPSVQPSPSASPAATPVPMPGGGGGGGAPPAPTPTPGTTVHGGHEVGGGTWQ